MASPTVVAADASDDGQHTPLAEDADLPLPALTHEVQARVEGVRIPEVIDGARYVEFKGEKFRIADETGDVPLLMYAAAAEEGLDSTNFSGLAAMFAMVKDCIHDDAEWRRFLHHALIHKAKIPDLMTVVNQVVELLTARPTTPPGDSSPGRPSTSENSKATSSLPAADGADGLVSVDSLLGR